jgi:hypothetical protein
MSLARDAVREVLTALAPFRESIARRSRRDVLRVDRYFREMDEDLARRARGRGRGTGLARKRQLLPAERQRRLENLRENRTIRVRLSPIAYVLAQSPLACADLTVLRRSKRREVRVYWHPLLRRWLPLRCEGCGVGTYAIGACDDAVHLLCAACLGAGGRACPVCDTGSGGPDRRVEVAGRTEEILVPGFARGSALGDEEAAPGDAAGEADRTPPADDLAARVRRALAASPGEVASEDLQRLAHAAASELRPILRELVERGEVSKTGRARRTRYRWTGRG